MNCKNSTFCFLQVISDSIYIPLKPKRSRLYSLKCFPTFLQPAAVRQYGLSVEVCQFAPGHVFGYGINSKVLTYRSWYSRRPDVSQTVPTGIKWFIADHLMPQLAFCPVILKNMEHIMLYCLMCNEHYTYPKVLYRLPVTLCKWVFD